MAYFPLPIGFDRMMREIAEGIGEAGRTLPERSRSEVGALAVRSASVEINFELSAEARDEKTGTAIGAGLGVRSFLFSSETQSRTSEWSARNTGRITLEIVAIIEPEARDGRTTDGRKTDDHRPVTPPKVPPDILPESPPEIPPGIPDVPDPTGREEAARLMLAIGRMRAALPGLDIADVERKQVAALIEMAAAQVEAGNLTAARDIITQLAPGFAALGRAADTPDREKG